MKTHDDRLHFTPFMDELERRAKEMHKNQLSTIAAGASGEKIVEEWRDVGRVNFSIRKMPDDAQGILRISIGGGQSTPVNLNYLTFRGDIGEIEELLVDALEAIRLARYGH